MSKMEEGWVNSQINDGICRITFYHPQSNSMPGYLLKKLAIEINSTDKKEGIKVIILQSNGPKAFCAGASFDELMKIKSLDAGIEFFKGFADVINAIRVNSKLVIGRIHGKVVGGGVGLVAACDYALAINEASIRLSEFTLGIGPFVVAPAIDRKIGKSAFTQMTIDTQWQTARWAHEKGLYNKLFDSVESMDIAVDSLAVHLSKLSNDASFALKKIFWEGTEQWDKLLADRAKISAELTLSDFTQNHLKELKEKK